MQCLFGKFQGKRPNVIRLDPELLSYGRKRDSPKSISVLDKAFILLHFDSEREMVKVWSVRPVMKDKNLEEVGGIAGPSEGSDKGTDLTVEAKGVGVANVEVRLLVSGNGEVEVQRPPEGMEIEGNDEVKEVLKERKEANKILLGLRKTLGLERGLFLH